MRARWQSPWPSGGLSGHNGTGIRTARNGARQSHLKPFVRLAPGTEFIVENGGGAGVRLRRGGVKADPLRHKHVTLVLRSLLRLRQLRSPRHQVTRRGLVIRALLPPGLVRDQRRKPSVQYFEFLLRLVSNALRLRSSCLTPIPFVDGM